MVGYAGRQNVLSDLHANCFKHPEVGELSQVHVHNPSPLPASEFAQVNGTALIQHQNTSL